MWLVLKFHVYHDHAVLYVKEAEIGVVVRMCHKNEETGVDYFFGMQMCIVLASLFKV